MQIEITEKEKTALSILLGLRQKFSREKDQTYSARELHKLFSEVIGKINRNELRYLDTIIVAHNPEKKQDPIWDTVDEAIERSKIKRYDWKGVFDKSLTQAILVLKKNGLNVDETYNDLCKNPKVVKFLEDHGKVEQKKILENLKISVHARYGENNTAKKVMEEKEE